jgi:hypothetical protein
MTYITRDDCVNTFIIIHHCSKIHNNVHLDIFTQEQFTELLMR